jgi:hypothetical protein
MACSGTAKKLIVYTSATVQAEAFVVELMYDLQITSS